MKRDRIKRPRRTSRDCRRLVLEALEARLLLANWTGNIPDGTVWRATPGVVETVTGLAIVPEGATLNV